MPFYQIIAIIGSLVIIISLVDLVRRRKLKENYSLLWFGISFIFLLLSLSRKTLVYIAMFLGVDYAPAALFLILIMGLYVLSIHFSLVISRLSETNKDSCQEIGLLKLEVKKLKEWMQKPKKT